jgi:hypothetical protein
MLLIMSGAVLTPETLEIWKCRTGKTGEGCGWKMNSPAQIQFPKIMRFQKLEKRRLESRPKLSRRRTLHGYLANRQLPQIWPVFRDEEMYGLPSGEGIYTVENDFFKRRPRLSNSCPHLGVRSGETGLCVSELSEVKI